MSMAPTPNEIERTSEQPPDSGEHLSDPNPPREETGTVDRSAALLRRISLDGRGRVIAACAAGTVGPWVVWHVLSTSTQAIERLAQSPVPAGAERVIIASMAAHAVVSVATVFFGYTMIRAAERLLVPKRLLQDKQDVEVIRAILGIDTPTNTIASQVKAATNETVDVITKVLRAARGAKDTDEK